MTPPRRDGSADSGSYTFNTSASGYAQVGVNAGIVNGDVHYYEVRGDQAADKYRVALNFLSGDMPRRAEDLINEAVTGGLLDKPAGYSYHHIAYHWILAIVSGRSFDHLGPQAFTHIQHAASIAETDKALSDEWTAALHVVNQMVAHLLRQEQTGVLDQAELDQVLHAYSVLDPDRRDEIRRHLGMILIGRIQDQLDDAYAQEVRERRMRGRQEHSWKYFQPVPEPPRARAATPPEFSFRQLAGTVTGGAAAATWLGWSLAIISHLRVAVFAAVAVLLGGGYLAVRFGTEWLALRGLVVDNDRRLDDSLPPSRYSAAIPAPATEADDEDTAAARRERRRRRRVRRELRGYVDYRFHKETPKDTKQRQAWRTEVGPVAAAMKRELLAVYGESGMQPGAVNWLIKWRVRQVKARWQDGTLRSYRDDLRVPGRVALASLLGALLACTGVAALLVWAVADDTLTELGLAALLIAGAALMLRCKLDVYLVLRRRLPDDRADADRQLHDEHEAYEKWCDDLDGRPTDQEMAHWLDYDKMYFKTLAMNLYGLASRDLVAHAVLTGSGDWRRCARVVGGPWRYSNYVISVFLLTAAGVRFLRANLDFVTGTFSNQHRKTFRYDAITSARIAEIGIRFDGGRRSFILLEEDRPRQGERPDSIILSQGFWLTLTNGESISVYIDNFDEGLVDRVREDPRRLFELALDTSGISAAIRILESIAAEGRDWIAEERQRRSRRLEDFKRHLGARGMLAAGPEDEVPALAGERTAIEGRRASSTRRARARESHDARHEPPIVVLPGEQVSVGRSCSAWPDFVFVDTTHGSGWVPEQYVDVDADPPVMLKGYDTAELHARAGEMFTMLGFDTLTGWAWVRNDDGEEGWLPGDILEATRPSS